MDQFERPVLQKIRIATVLKGTVLAGEQWSSGVLTVPGRRILVADVIATVVDVNDGSMIIDDGTGRLGIRTFSGVNPPVGTLVRVIGKPRTHEGQTILMADIVKTHIDPDFIALRALEIEYFGGDAEEVVEAPKPEAAPPQENVIDVIKNLDGGNGADYDDVLAKIGNAQVLERLLARGDIFEIRPGRLKVID